ncbi:SRPBCC domain-containing protein [Micromonospora pisi]|uniref:SRPBCC domain-containing protein n=1 Tax=Micromonospora pisi TaxID=589240 RepID=UPI0011C35DFE|nr:SRPBCC domain-containing protein [Micromonospora pisi]
MTDIRTEAELRHPVSRVWRALTDAQLLGQWLGATDLQPEAGAPFELTPIDLPGVEGEVNGAVVEVVEPQRLVLRWREDGVRVLVSFELIETEQGCLITVRQSGTDGHWTSEQEEQRQQAYGQLLSGPLPAVLDWLAFREVDFTSETAEADGAAAGAAQGAVTANRDPEQRRRRLVGGLIGTAIVVGAAMVVGALIRPTADPTTAAAIPPSGAPASDGSATGGPPSPAVSGAASSSRSGTSAPSATTTASASPSTTPSAGTPSTQPATANPPAGAAAPPAQPNLDARYTRASSELLGYTGEIVVTNSGNAKATQWVVTVVLDGGATVADVSGARYDQKGRTVTFTGDSVAAGATARFRFQVNAALSERQPQSCRIGDRPCSGL